MFKIQWDESDNFYETGRGPGITRICASISFLVLGIHDNKWHPVKLMYVHDIHYMEAEMVDVIKQMMTHKLDEDLLNTLKQGEVRLWDEEEEYYLVKFRQIREVNG